MSIDYLHNKPPSYMSKILKSGMVLLGMKRKSLKESKNKSYSNQKPAKLPRSLLKNFNVNENLQDGRIIWTISQKKNPSDTIILYIHGGAYVKNISPFHWNLVTALAKISNATIKLPDYPLAPTTSFKEAYDYLDTLYTSLRNEDPSKKIIFMGDSAGGGLALGFAQKLREENIPQPEQIILFSPWLDITMSNPNITEVEIKEDKMLSMEALVLDGNAYAKKLDPKDYKVSPIYGKFNGLGKISVFIGTHDLFIADARKLKKIMKDENLPLNYFEYPEMFHVWVALPFLKESKHAMRQVSELIQG